MSEPTQAELTQEHREECRKAVRKYLAERAGVALHPRVILRGITAGHAADFTEPDVQAALSFLEGEGQAKREHTAMGATLYWQATSKGVLEHERAGF